VALLLVAPLPSSGRAAAETGPSLPAISLSYSVHVPDRPGPLPLVVFLHGCGADPAAYGFDENADAVGFVVAYPRAADGGCWHGTAEEAVAIAAITREVQDAEDVELERTSIAGHSAGSGMAALTAERNAGLYAAVGMISGVRATLITPPRPLAAYYAWGTRDATTPYLTGRLQLGQWLLRNDLADDGLPNLSMPLLPTSTQLRLGTGGVPTFLVEHYRDPRGCADVDFATGVGMGHIPDFDWPAIFPAMTSFLLSHRLSGC